MVLIPSCLLSLITGLHHNRSCIGDTFVLVARKLYFMCLIATHPIGSHHLALFLVSGERVEVAVSLSFLDTS